MAGPAVVALLFEVGHGLIEKHVGGKVIGLGVSVGGKFVVHIAKRGKVIAEELTESMAKKLRQRIDRSAKSGTAEARQLKTWIGKNAPKPGWTSTNRGTTEGNAAILRRNLGNTIKPGEHAHHIVQSTHRKADESRKLLDTFQIDINDAVNGVPLVGSGPKPAHHGNRLHSHDVIERVGQRLANAVSKAEDWADGRARLLRELAKLKTEISKGVFP